MAASIAHLQRMPVYVDELGLWEEPQQEPHPGGVHRGLDEQGLGAAMPVGDLQPPRGRK